MKVRSAVVCRLVGVTVAPALAMGACGDDAAITDDEALAPKRCSFGDQLRSVLGVNGAGAGNPDRARNHERET